MPAINVQSATKPWAVSTRADEVLLKLLDAVERDIAEGKPDSPHLAAYERLCRAESARAGRG